MEKKDIINHVVARLLDEAYVSDEHLNSGEVYAFNDYENEEGVGEREHYLEEVPVDLDSRTIKDECLLLLADPSIVRSTLLSNQNERLLYDLVEGAIESDPVLSTATPVEWEEEYAHELLAIEKELAIQLYNEKYYHYKVEFLYEPEDFAELVYESLYDRVVEPSIEALTEQLNEKIFEQSFQREILLSLGRDNRTTLIYESELFEQVIESETVQRAISEGVITEENAQEGVYIEDYATDIDFHFEPNERLTDIATQLYDDLRKSRNLVLVDLTTGDQYALNEVDSLERVLNELISRPQRFYFNLSDIRFSSYDLIEYND